MTKYDPETGEIGLPKLFVRNRKDVLPEPAETFEDALYIQGWSEDPKDGSAVLTPDGREIVNPMPIAPPIGYTAERSVMEMIEDALKRRMAQLDGDEEIETIEEADDFGDDDEPAPWSPYEVVMVDEYPAIPSSSSSRSVPPDSVVSGEAPPEGDKK